MGHKDFSGPFIISGFLFRAYTPFLTGTAATVSIHKNKEKKKGKKKR